MSVLNNQTSTTKTRILISNDDGIDAPGLQALCEGVSAVPSFDVRVGAPDSERSGSSHAFRYIIGATHYPPGTKEGLPQKLSAFSTSGYPADAVRLPFLTNIYGDNWLPELVISGVNRGGNGGKNIIISGTIGAAREAVLQGVRGLAVSLHLRQSGGREKADYAHGVQLLLPIIEWFIQESKWPESVLLNVNVPFNGRPKLTENDNVDPVGMIVVPQGKSCVACHAEPYGTANGTGVNDDDHTNHYRVKYKYNPDPEGTVETDDVIAMNQGYLTLTPMAAYGTGEDVKEALKILKQWSVEHRHPSLTWRKSDF
eukprot:g4386.t1